MVIPHESSFASSREPLTPGMLMGECVSRGNRGFALRGWVSTVATPTPRDKDAMPAHVRAPVAATGLRNTPPVSWVWREAPRDARSRQDERPCSHRDQRTERTTLTPDAWVTGAREPHRVGPYRPLPN